MFILILTPFFSNSYAADSTQLNLPESAKFRLGKGKISQIKFSPDGSRFAVLSSIGIWIFNTHTEEEIYLIPTPESGATRIAFSPDGKTFAIGRRSIIQLSDIETGELKYKLTGHRNYISSIAFNLHGRILASGRYRRYRPFMGC